MLQTNWAEQAGLLYCQPVQDKNRRFYLLALSPTVPEASAAMKQAVEVIRLFISMWHYDYRQDTEEELLRVLLDGIGGQRTKLLKKFRVDLSSIGGIWLLRDRTPHVSAVSYTHLDVYKRQFISYATSRNGLSRATVR